MLRAAAAALAVACFAVAPGIAAAEPGSGPRETIDQSYTTTLAGVPTGLGWKATYHAPGDPAAPPPAMKRMIFYPPAGFRFDTKVPERCTASDLELELRGPAACPAGSRLGAGSTEGLILMPFTHSFVFDHFTHHLDVINNANEQVLLIESEGWTVQRGTIHRDNSVEFNTTTCFPAPPAGGCADDYIIQLGSTTTMPLYANQRGSYATTPPTCPTVGYWVTTVRFWWMDGTTDSVESRQPCSASAA